MRFFLPLAVATILLGSPIPCIALPNQIMKIGVLSGLTGVAAKRSNFQNMGITLAVEELKATGINVKILTEDSATNGSKALSAFQKLYAHDGVAAVISNDFGFAVAPVIATARKQQRFLISINKPQDTDCAAPVKYFHSLAADHGLSGEAFEKFLLNHPEIKKIALFTFDDPAWGRVYKEVWRAVAQSKGVEVVYAYETDSLLPDFRTPLAQAINRKPDALLFAHEPVSFLRTAKQLGFMGTIIAANNVYEVLADAEKTPKDLEGIYVIDPVVDPIFRQKFINRFGKAPILEAYAGYDVLHAVVKAVVAGEGDPEKGMAKVDFVGAGGDIRFSGQNCSGSHVTWEISRPY